MNTFLTTLAGLVVKTMISARRAAVLAYITNQLLRTLPAIEHELSPPVQEPTWVIDLPRPSGSSADRDQ